YIGKKLDAGVELSNRLPKRRTPVGTPSGSEPVRDGSLSERRRREVAGERLGLRLSKLRKRALQHVGYASVQVCTATLEHRLISRVLNQRVPKGVFRVRRNAVPIHEFRADQLRQCPSSCGCGMAATALICSCENCRPSAAPICATSRTGARRSS